MKKILRILIPFLLSLLICLLVIEAPKSEKGIINVSAKKFKDPAQVNYVQRIDINYDTTKARLSPAYTAKSDTKWKAFGHLLIIFHMTKVITIYG